MRFQHLVLVALGTVPALAHVNDRGMDYTLYKDHAGVACCDHTDCRPADDFAEVKERGQVRLLIDGQWINVPRAVVVAHEFARWTGALVRREALHQLAPRMGTVCPDA